MAHMSTQIHLIKFSQPVIINFLTEIVVHSLVDRSVFDKKKLSLQTI